MENQPLIVKEVDEEVQTKDDTKPSQAWLPSQLLGSDLAASKADIGPFQHWLELSTRKMVPSPRCELCGYNYRRRNCINLSSLHFPHISARDRLLNLLFLFVFGIMVVCAVLSIHFLQLSEQYHSTLR
ncbi:hypothetical protein OESDEN_15581 [Oesophagostomum dentatum]|uniref:Uncharacterized protein n=1 Tax=Oesophagostomum dentatum TaxID=61180 RepID=A0A0B1SMG9_OESDE|nr:hypothetical protein OESDEN_15581 [Oesophagostomum dentatum]